jgi:hypothetical protein
MVKVAELEGYLTNKLSNDDYMALYPSEQWFIMYWTKDYERLITSVKQYDSIYPLLSRKVQPASDPLYMMLREKTLKQREFIINQIKGSLLTDQDKDFLVMHLNACLLNKGTKKGTEDLTQDSLNYQANQFFSKYPKSEMISFTRKYIRYQLVPSKWGFTFEFFTGYGIFSGDLKNHYTNNIPMGVAFDVYYKNLAFYLRDYIGFSNTKHDFTNVNGNVVWDKNSQVRVYLPELSVGYVIKEDKHLKLAPFVGISSTDISATEYDLKDNPDLKQFELSFTTTYSVGFNVDLKLRKPRNAMATSEQSYFFLRLRYGYNFPQFANSYSGFGGNMQYITIGIGGFARRMIRDY